MSKEKQIEEMARDISEIQYLGGLEHKLAELLFERGYLKQKGYFLVKANGDIVPIGQSEWISVEERLPSEDERRDEYGELVPFLVCEKYTKYPYRAFYDGTIWGDGLMKIKGITHWMPLPEPPKMKGGAE